MFFHGFGFAFLVILYFGPYLRTFWGFCSRVREGKSRILREFYRVLIRFQRIL